MILNHKYFIQTHNKHLLKELQNSLGEPCLVITHTPSNKSPNVFDYSDMVFADYHEVDWSQVEPLDSEILKEMGGCERIYLKMADRLTPGSSYQQRKDEYVKHLRFWHWRLSRDKSIELAIFENVPHEGFDFVIYSILRLLKIPVISFYSLPARPHRVVLRYPLTDIFNHGREVEETYKQICANIQDEKLTPNSLSKALRFALEEQENSNDIESFALPCQVKDNSAHVAFTYLSKALFNLFKFRFLVLIKSFSRLAIKNTIAEEWLFLLQNRNPYFETQAKVERFYQRNSANVDLGAPFIYFPLHFQPECSTSPLGEDYVDQALVCEMLSWIAGQDVKIYIKEHPRPSRAYHVRNVAFYKRLLNCGNVVLVNRDMDTYKLIDASIAVATVTGSAGWEAFLRRKPVLIFGSRIYESAPNVFRIKSKDDLTDAYQKIRSGGLNPDREGVLRYLMALDCHVFEAHVGKRQKLFSTVDADTSISNIVNQIEKYVSILIRQRGSEVDYNQ